MATVASIEAGVGVPTRIMAFYVPSAASARTAVISVDPPFAPHKSASKHDESTAKGKHHTTQVTLWRDPDDEPLWDLASVLCELAQLAGRAIRRTSLDKAAAFSSAPRPNGSTFLYGGVYAGEWFTVESAEAVDVFMYYRGTAMQRGDFASGTNLRKGQMAASWASLAMAPRLLSPMPSSGNSTRNIAVYAHSVGGTPPFRRYVMSPHADGDNRLRVVAQDYEGSSSFPPCVHNLFVRDAKEGACGTVVHMQTLQHDTAQVLAVARPHPFFTRPIDATAVHVTLKHGVPCRALLHGTPRPTARVFLDPGILLLETKRQVGQLHLLDIWLGPAVAFAFVRDHGATFKDAMAVYGTVITAAAQAEWNATPVALVGPTVALRASVLRAAGHLVMATVMDALAGDAGHPKLHPLIAAAMDAPNRGWWCSTALAGLQPVDRAPDFDTLQIMRASYDHNAELFAGTAPILVPVLAARRTFPMFGVAPIHRPLTEEHVKRFLIVLAQNVAPWAPPAPLLARWKELMMVEGVEISVRELQDPTLLSLFPDGLRELREGAHTYLTFVAGAVQSTAIVQRAVVADAALAAHCASSFFAADDTDADDSGGESDDKSVTAVLCSDCLTQVDGQLAAAGHKRGRLYHYDTELDYSVNVSLAKRAATGQGILITPPGQVAQGPSAAMTVATATATATTTASGPTKNLLPDFNSKPLAAAGTDTQWMPQFMAQVMPLYAAFVAGAVPT